MLYLHVALTLGVVGFVAYLFAVIAKAARYKEPPR